MTLKEIVLEARDTIAGIFSDDPYLPELMAIIDCAVELSENTLSDLDNIHRIGEGWVAEETLGISISWVHFWDIKRLLISGNKALNSPM